MSFPQKVFSSIFGGYQIDALLLSKGNGIKNYMGKKLEELLQTFWSSYHYAYMSSDFEQTSIKCDKK